MAFSGAGGANLGSARGEIIISTQQAEASLRQLQGGITNFGTSAEGAFQRVATGLGLLAASRGLANVFGGMVGQAANLEAQLSGVSAALGGVGTEAGITQEQFDDLEQSALDIGASTSKSATEAAASMELLARAGLDVETILDGAAAGAVHLSEATGEGLQQSSETMAAMILLFEQTGITAERATDIITTGMNASSASMNEFQTGMARLAPTITLAGLSMEEAAAAVAFFNAQGFSAAEVGTSLNTAYENLIKPTDDAAAALAQLGVEAFDAQGRFIGFPALFDQVQKGAAKFGDESERNAILLRAFGKDALDVMGRAATQGGDALRELEGEMAQTGTAADASAVRMDNFAGSMEQLRGALETASISVGRIFLPALRQIVDGITLVVNAFSALPTGFQAFTGIAIAASAAIAGIAGVMVLAGPRMAEFGTALRTVRVALLGMNPLLLALVAGIALFVQAWRTNFGGIQDITRRVGDEVTRFFRIIAAQFEIARTSFGNVGAVLRAFALALNEVTGINVVKQFTAVAKIADRLGKNLGRMRRQLGILSRAIERGGLAEGFDRLFGDVGRNLLAEFGDVLGALPRTVGVALRQIETGMQPLDTILHNLGSGLEQFGRVIENVFAGNFDRAAENLSNGFRRMQRAARGIGTLIITGAVALGGVLFDVAADAWGWVTGNFSNAVNFAFRLGELTLRGAVAVIGLIGDLAPDVWGWIKRQFRNYGDDVLRMGSLLLRGSVVVAGVIAEASRDVWGWIKQQFQNIGDDALRLGALTIDSAVRFGAFLGDVIPNVWGWVKRQARNIYNDALALGTLVVTGTVEFVSSDEFSLTASSIGQGIVDAIVGLATFADEVGNAIVGKITSIDWLAVMNQFGTGEDFGVALRGLIIRAIDAIDDITAEDVASVVTKIGKAMGAALIAAPAAAAVLATSVATFIAGAIKGLIFGEGEIDWSGALNSLVSTFTNALAGVAGQIRDALAGLFTGGGTRLVMGPGGDFAGATFEEIAGPFDDIDWSSVATSILEGIGQAITDAATEAGDVIADLASSLQNAITADTFTSLAADIASGIWEGMKSWFSDKNPLDLFGGAPDAEEIAESVRNAQNQSRPSGGGGAGHGGGFDQSTGLIDGRRYGQGFGEGAVTEIETALGALKPPTLPARADAASGTTPAKPPKVPAADTTALQRSLAEAHTNTVRVTQTILRAVQGMAGPLGSAARGAGLAFVSAVQGAFQQAVAAAASGANAVVAAARANLGSLAGAGFSVGQSLGFGIANGIRSTINAVAAEAARLVFSARDAANRAAQIASPSRLFAEIGQQLSAGMAIGISDGTRTVQGSMVDLISAITPTTSPTSLLGSQPTAAAARGGGSTTIIQVFALKTDEYLELIENAQAGRRADLDLEAMAGRGASLVMGV